MKYILLTSLLLTGCAEVQTAEIVLSKVVADYCKAPEVGRLVIRKKVANVLEPNSIQINCNK
jgi:hypothetical protein